MSKKDEVKVAVTPNDGKSPDPRATVENSHRKEIQELEEKLKEAKESEIKWQDLYYNELTTRSKYEHAFKALVEELAKHINK